MLFSQALTQLEHLTQLPRPVYGHLDAITNTAISQQHSHPWGQLSFAVQGVLQIETATARYLAPPNQAVWIPAGISHGVSCSQNTQIRSLYIEPAAVNLSALACQVLQINPLSKELINAFSYLPEKYVEASADGRLVAVLLDQLAAATTSQLSLPWPKDRRLKKLCQLLASEPSTNLTLEELGFKLGVSSKTLTRLFLQETGMNFRQWRQRCRILAALPLLEAGLRITDLALACGYSSQAAFAAAFKEQLGVSPTQYLQQT